MEGIGIIGYAAPSPTGIVVRELREKLDITEHFAVYDYAAGGFDNKWAEGVWAGGFPRSGVFTDRWDWEIRRDELDDWIKERHIKAVILVGNTFGENTVKWIKDWTGVKVIFVRVPGELRDQSGDADGWPNLATVDALLYADNEDMPWPIATDDDKAKWQEAIRAH